MEKGNKCILPPPCKFGKITTCKECKFNEWGENYKYKHIDKFSTILKDIYKALKGGE